MKIGFPEAKNYHRRTRFLTSTLYCAYPRRRNDQGAENAICASPLGASFLLHKRLSKLGDLSPPVTVEMYHKIYLNCAAKFGGFTLAQMSRVHTWSSLKNQLGIKRSTQNDFLYGECGILSLAVQHKLIILRYWAKIVDGNKAHFVTNSYNIVYNDTLEHVNRKNCSILVLVNAGFTKVLAILTHFYAYSYPTNRDQYGQQWQTNLDKTATARTIRPTISPTKRLAIGPLAVILVISTPHNKLPPCQGRNGTMGQTTPDSKVPGANMGSITGQ